MKRASNGEASQSKKRDQDYHPKGRLRARDIDTLKILEAPAYTRELLEKLWFYREVLVSHAMVTTDVPSMRLWR